MAEDTAEPNRDGLARLESATRDFARVEVARIGQTVIGELRSRPAFGMFDDVGARHMWDEYCWTLQEGPFDDDMDFGGLRLGSISGNWDEMVRAIAMKEVKKLPEHTLIFLSAASLQQERGDDEELSLGTIWLDGIVETVMQKVSEYASQRNLDLIGPNRDDVICSEIEGAGLVWSALLERGEAENFVSGRTDKLIDPDADLSELAEEMVEAFLAISQEEAEGDVIAEFLERFGGNVRQMLLEKDVLPSLREMRLALIERLDGPLG